MAQEAPEPAQAPYGWWWLALLGGAAVAITAAGLWVRRRQAARPPVVIEKPVPGSAPQRKMPIADALTLRVEALKVTRSFAFATVEYRLTLVNRTPAALTGLAVCADVVAAHSAAPVEHQLANATSTIEVRHRVERMGPNQSLRLEGQVRLPLGDVQVIRQRGVPLLVPLLRVLVSREGDAEGAIVKTVVVGQGAPGGGRVRPFNLAETPRSYTEVAQRELA